MKITHKSGHKPKVAHRRTERFELRITKAERTAFEEAATLSGIELSAWVRERLRLASRKELEKLSKPIPFLEEPATTPDDDIRTGRTKTFSSVDEMLKSLKKAF